MATNDVLSRELLRDVLCCAECEQPLATTHGGGSWCTTCNYPPSMQDTFIMRVCRCGGEPKRDGTDLKCRCGLRYR